MQALKDTATDRRIVSDRKRRSSSPHQKDAGETAFPRSEHGLGSQTKDVNGEEQRASSTLVRRWDRTMHNAAMPTDPCDNR